LVTCQDELLSWLLDTNTKLDSPKDKFFRGQRSVEHQRTEPTQCKNYVPSLGENKAVLASKQDTVVWPMLNRRDTAIRA
jgi:hypothetical protein